MRRTLIGLGIVAALVACASAATSNRRVQTVADTRPFQPNNMPVGDTASIQADDRGKISIVDKSPKTSTLTAPEDLSPPTHPKADTATLPPDEDPNTSGE